MRWKLSGASTRNGITVIARGKVWMLMITWHQCKVQFDKAINTRQAVPSVVQRGWSDLWSEVKWCGNLKENKRKPTHLHIFHQGCYSITVFTITVIWNCYVLYIYIYWYHLSFFSEYYPPGFIFDFLFKPHNGPNNVYVHPFKFCFFTIVIVQCLIGSSSGSEELHETQVCHKKNDHLICRLSKIVTRQESQSQLCDTQKQSTFVLHIQGDF